MAIIYCYGDTPINDSLAKETAETLTWLYPNHSWWVEAKQGVITIRNLAVSGARGTIGMLRHISALANDATARRRELMRAAGELLERAGLPRGAYSGEHVKKMELDEGLAKHWRPSPVPVAVIH